MTVLLKSEHRWSCPNCTTTVVTYLSEPHSKMHACKGLHGMTVPMVSDGVKSRVYAVERGDYIGKELVTLDGEGRPIMSVITERDDGQDCTVYAPTAFGRGDSV